MTTTKTPTLAGRKALSQVFDKLANTIEAHGEALGIPARIAEDFGLRCDILSDVIYNPNKEATLTAPADETGMSVEPTGGFDPNAIADDQGGPHQQESDESYMTGEFAQKEFHELTDKVESGMASADPRRASLARLAAMQRKATADSLRGLADSLKSCHARIQASKAPGVGAVLSNLAAMYGALDTAADDLLKLDATGEGSPELIVSADRMAQAVSEILPHLEDLEVMAIDQASPTALLEYEKMMEEGSVPKLVSLAARLVADAAKDAKGASKEASKKGEDDAVHGEDEDRDKKEAAKKAEDDDEADDAADEKEAGKKSASTVFNLFI